MDLSYNYTAIIFFTDYIQNPVQVPGFSLSREKVGGTLFDGTPFSVKHSNLATKHYYTKKSLVGKGCVYRAHVK